MMEMSRKSDAYNPRIKRLLKSFKATAEHSLNGPAADYENLAGLHSSSPTSEEAYDPGISSESGFLERFKRFPAWLYDGGRVIGMQVPILLSMDRTVSEATETTLEGESIACFEVGGEKRLCLPQILKNILNSFTLPQINSAYEELHVFSSLSSPGQLEILKGHGILPSTAHKCGLITKSDAQRLCSILLRRNGDSASRKTLSFPQGSGFRVVHKCFGKCRGIFIPMMYEQPNSPAIQCLECGAMLTPPDFVSHFHESLENRTCHWGFDSGNWRQYLKLDKYQKNVNKLQQHFDEVMSLFDKSKPYKRHQEDVDDDKNSFSATKKSRTDSTEDDAEDKWENVEPENSSCDEYHADMEQPTDGKANDEKLSTSSYLQTGLPVLLHPDQVVPLMQACRQFAPNVSLAPESYNKVENSRVKMEDQWEESCDSSLRKIPISKRRHDFGYNSGYASELHGRETDPKSEVQRMQDLELKLFQTVQDRSCGDGLDEEERQNILSKFLDVQKRFLQLTTSLLESQETLQQDLNFVQTKLKKVHQDQKSREEELAEVKLANDTKLEDARNDICRLKEQITAMINGSKRSDIGLTKAKYKAQIEHFQRKLQNANQVKAQLQYKLVNLQARSRMTNGPTVIAKSITSRDRFHTFSGSLPMVGQAM